MLCVNISSSFPNPSFLNTYDTHRKQNLLTYIQGQHQIYHFLARVLNTQKGLFLSLKAILHARTLLQILTNLCLKYNFVACNLKTFFLKKVQIILIFNFIFDCIQYDYHYFYKKLKLAGFRIDGSFKFVQNLFRSKFQFT